MRMGVWFN